MHYKTSAFKYWLLGVSLLATSFFFCNPSSKNVPSQIIHRDTSRILATYIDGKQKIINYAPVYMIIKDSLMWKDVDSSTQKKQWEKDTTFFIPMGIDSIRRTPDYLPVIRQSVSIERNFDSAIAILQRFVIAHPQYFPKPSVNAVKKDSMAIKDSSKKKNQ